ncbi:MAG: hypothetical protein HRT97_05745 [Moritella sp.]|uniref:hypothetical protein n=1 Tax=Moritella sp. TaxID=78556 RepID=UPI0025EE0E9F|nr:hypothetical protein [Moritella sp.]NQZ91833.1 hypothetical protein [Moritella sp.]
MNVTEYRYKLEQSSKLTKSWGLSTEPLYNECPEKTLTKSQYEEISILLQTILGEFSDEEISQQCFALSLIIKEEIEEKLNIPLMYTLGYVKPDKHPVFYTDEHELKKYLNQTSQSKHINLHAWLTTANNEIIDVTYNTTVGVVCKQPNLIGHITMGHISELKDGFEYHPQLIGDEFLYACGFLISQEAFIM